ncbi:MAG: 2-oxoacid:ferredoxin oxidoreductase subunit beta [Alphaproteobacteria bacterium]|nr:2-oxoacid:ferredoxin oxidoreductase subunit beta [Alphaproteobacteria bacterium]
MNVQSPPGKLKARDFATDQEVRWCPGCGDYAILKAVQNTLAELEADPKNTVFVSGIGCAARFPYYMETYGFHTIHGRSPAVATGVKLSNPKLDVWVVGGDGDMLSIGGNHTMHAIRRNIDVQLLLFNNQIYGLTKGQYSPTSKIGTRSPSTPMGSIDNPVSAAQFALGVGGTFISRSTDILVKHLSSVLKRAHGHRGTSFVEIFQNCIVYNDGVFKHFTEKSVQDEMQIHVEHGQPLLFGKDKSKGLVLNMEEMRLEAVTLGEDGITEADIAVHDETNRSLATMLAQMDPPIMPVALGVLYCESAPTYDSSVHAQIEHARKDGEGDLTKLLHGGQTWTVE